MMYTSDVMMLQIELVQAHDLSSRSQFPSKFIAQIPKIFQKTTTYWGIVRISVLILM